jgi:hypothetical protein
MSILARPRADLLRLCLIVELFLEKGNDDLGMAKEGGALRLQLGLDRPEQPEAHLVVIARERDHETTPPVAFLVSA